MDHDLKLWIKSEIETDFKINKDIPKNNEN
jgi:hypothetical protein